MLKEARFDQMLIVIEGTAKQAAATRLRLLWAHIAGVLPKRRMGKQTFRSVHRDQKLGFKMSV